MNPAFFRVGLTGGVGSGKSTIAGMFRRNGVAVVDSDAIAHELTQAGGAAIQQIKQIFGDAAINAEGALDRAWMRARAFADPAARRTLEAVLHPRIRVESEQRAARHFKAGSPYVIFMIPLLVEAGNWRGRFSRVLTVDCTEATQIARACARPGIDLATACSIIAAQASRSERLAAADDVIFNEAPLDEVGVRVDRLHARYLQRAAAALSAAL